MIERDEESNINEEISSYNPGRVQDGGYMNKVRNQIGVVFVRFRLSDQLRSSADPINDFGVVNVADPEA
ncbi:hypothetical protein MTR_3g014250 [Medicago truncatula]|uniref:Uncharacterized protein n=1 Tax=Medicago truncatula TaxID=3880 RepID=G7J0H3_MEDTR|nr:hypothetical protein MTR_3g014250 [Medicago truncatula]